MPNPGLGFSPCWSRAALRANFQIFEMDFDAILEDSPHKVRQKRKKQQHEHTADPDQKIQSHLRGVDLFLVHALTLPRSFVRNIGSVR
jgi:hypothetical protein